jgi:hypothetical protein
MRGSVAAFSLAGVRKKPMKFKSEQFLNLTDLLGKAVFVGVLVAHAACVVPITPAPKPTPSNVSTGGNVLQALRAVGSTVVTTSNTPIAGASCALQDTPGWTPNATSQANGYVVWSSVTSSLRNTAIRCSASGYNDYLASAVLQTGADENLPPIVLVPSFPAPPPRAELLNVRLTFQGLTVPTAQFGALPWFEAALPWLSPADRLNAYAAKHASPAWPGGDTHAIVFLPHGPPLYDEPGQPYSADRFPALDWTAGDTAISPQLPALVADVVQHGFRDVLLFLGGDDGEAGYLVATKEAPLVAEALRTSPWGDLRPYVVLLPGWDGVFYGYTPDHIHQWGALCRSLMPYCGLEHSTGHIPAGDGPGEWWAPSGPMRSYDLLLSEFDDGRFDDSVWQIAARMLGPQYARPPDQPSGDDPNPPFYLKDPTDRGPIVNCAFEFYEYGWVRNATPAEVSAARQYFKNVGYPCGG